MSRNVALNDIFFYFSYNKRVPPKIGHPLAERSIRNVVNYFFLFLLFYCVIFTPTKNVRGCVGP